MSGPARRTAPAGAPARATQVGALARRISPSRLWIPVIAAAVIGLVTLQLLHLQFEHAAGTAIERQETLQRQDAALNVEDSVLSSAQHIQAVAQTLGMAMVASGSLHILNGNGAPEARRAAAAVGEPGAAPVEPVQTSAAPVESTSVPTEATGTTQAPAEPGASPGGTTPPATTEPSAAPTSTAAGGASVPAG